MIYAPLGTISHATLRTRDLLEEFEWVVRHLAERNLKQTPDEEMFKRHLRLCEDARKLLEVEEWDEDQDEEAGVLVNEDFFEALQEYAPPYVQFGTNEGDGSDFGFWPSIESLQEDSRYRDGCVLKIDAGDPWPTDAYERAAKGAGWKVDESPEAGIFSREFGVFDATGKRRATAASEWEAWQEACRLAGVKPELKDGIEYVMEVTDHGNVSLYDREGKELWSCV
jgi:hypothetical protein